jgi:hypothetical protein
MVQSKLFFFLHPLIMPFLLVGAIVYAYNGALQPCIFSFLLAHGKQDDLPVSTGYNYEYQVQSVIAD